ncbi:hypothetical protein [Streptococcus pneumoniae]|uniref:hypothetical protein n=1 Tax=Streptococcus pneumoniae TaxID=1313 RepID=UPI0010E5FFD3|nr:hypothetical protein [Streptococcus pneumoniae]CAG5548509.1 Uncharacterised protein [Streptococcus pneumoniae]VKC64757.1 Uncharacterised protein [Streptococcus pneumoniae]HEW6292316.1 hypothetical protein [Streptococcus pneumoniae]
MFLKQSRLKPYPMRRFEKTVTEEGVAKEGYAKEAETVRLELWPATIKVKDGVCIDSQTEVTHRVISKKVYTHHQVLELERVRATRGR